MVEGIIIVFIYLAGFILTAAWLGWSNKKNGTPPDDFEPFVAMGWFVFVPVLVLIVPMRYAYIKAFSLTYKK